MYYLKLITLVAVTLTLIILTTQTFAAIQKKPPLLVLDMRNIPQLPRHFRTSKPLATKSINWSGLTELHIAGGAQFSRLSLEKILNTLAVKQLTIIDLRQEPHGFLNGNAISWYGPHNAYYEDNTPEQIEAIQTELLSELSSLDTVTANQITKKTEDEESLKTKPIEFSVHAVFSESQLIETYHLKYHRLYVTDFHAPTATQVDQFIELAKQFPENQWIYFHCRAGVGRTTTFMAMYDMMRNAKQIPFKDIIARQHAIGGKDLTQLPSSQRYKYDYAVERMDFLKQFYAYAKTNKDDFHSSFSQWLSTKDAEK